MGTTYKVHDDGGTVIEIDEGSNQFTVHMQNVEVVKTYVTGDEVERLAPSDGYVFTRTAMTTEALIELGARIIQTALYWMPDEASQAKARQIMRDGDPSFLRQA